MTTIIGDNTTSGFTSTGFNLTTVKQFEGGIHQVTLPANQKITEYGVLWTIAASNGTASGSVQVGLYDLDTDTLISGSAQNIAYNGATLTAGGVDVHVKATGLAIDISAHAGKRIGIGLAPPSASTSSGFKVGIRTLTGSQRNNHTSNGSTLPATFSVNTSTSNSSWGVYAITEDLPAAQGVTSINGGSSIPAGKTSTPAVLTGFTARPTVTTNAAGVTASNYGGTATNMTFDISDRVEAGQYPALPSSVLFTFTNGSESAQGSQNVTYKTGETKVTFSSPNTTDATYISKAFADDGHTVNAADFYYVQYSDLNIAVDGKITVTAAGTVTGWLRPSAGATAGKMYYYEITIVDGSITNVISGLASVSVTNYGLASYGLTSSGVQ